MSLRVGYACVNTQFPSAGRTVRLANAAPERLRELTAANLEALAETLRWNAAHDIRVFRVSWETVPFGSREANELRWWKELADPLERVGDLPLDCVLEVKDKEASALRAQSLLLHNAA